MILGLYRALTGIAEPVLDTVLTRRLRAGKEDPARLQERRGVAGLARPEGSLVWVHAASVGEAISAEPLLAALLARDPGLHVLLTSGTVTAAQMMAARLPARALHQYVPVDHPRWVRRFLDHWRPDAAIWIESELWPNLILEASARSIPMALVNARMSERSGRRWAMAGEGIRRLLTSFQVRLAQSDEAAERLTALAPGHPFACLGTLKAAGLQPLTQAAQADLERLRKAIGTRPVWLAASTHPGEEAVVAAAHKQAVRTVPGLLTLLAPRHPSRAPAILQELRQGGLAVACREEEGVPGLASDIFLIDRLGEMGIFQRLADVVFLAGSLSGRLGGHNPLEAAHCGKPLLFGPDMANQRMAADALLSAGAAETVAEAGQLAQALVRLFADADERARRGRVAQETAARESAAIDRIVEALGSILPKPSGQGA